MHTNSTHPVRRAFPFLAALALGALLALGLSPAIALADTSETGANRPESIAILHTNDIHAHGLRASDSAVGFGGVAGAKKAAQDVYGPENVVLVDAGDTILGSVAGALTRGEDIVTLMKAAGYDLAVPGNHDFDYGLARLRELNELAQEPLGSDATTTVASTFRYLASNVTRRDNGETLFPAYEIRHFGDIDVAFVGVVRPETPLTENPGIFEENGEIAWSFHGDDLAVRVQGAVDAAIAEGAEYVIAVTHLGQGASASLIGGVKGVDAVIDAHSHSIVSGQTVRNGDGEQIPIAQCGTRFQAFGTMVITPSDNPSPRDIASSVTHASPSTRGAALPEVDGLAAQLEERVSGTVVGTTEVALTVNAQGGETNLGDFVADAYRFVVPGAEVGLVNAGGIEAPSIATGGSGNQSSGNPSGGSGGGSAPGGAGGSDDGSGESTGGSGDSGEEAEVPTSYVDTFRLYNRWTGEHFYTQSVDERASLEAAGWTDEGTGWTSPAESDAPVYRLFNQWSGEHFYTTSRAERDALSEGGWTYEGVAFYSDPARGNAVYRLYNPYITSFTHHYTTSTWERDDLLESGWRLEGEAWYGA